MHSLVNSTKAGNVSFIYPYPVSKVPGMQWTQYISVEERKARRNRDIENQQIGFEEVAELERKQSKALPEALSDQQCYLTMSKTRFK